MSKTDMIDAITLHFSKKGQRLTNLSKSTLPTLKKIIEKYNLNMEELMEELRIHKINRQAEEKLRKDEQARIDAEREKQRENEKQDILMKWRLITDADREDIIRIAYDNHVNQLEKHNSVVQIMTDKLYADCVKQGSRVIRENINTLIVNGITVVNDYYSSIPTREDFVSKIDEYGEPYDFDYWIAFKNKKLVTELCDKRMIEKGFTIKDGQYWITIKTTIKKRVSTN